MSKLENFGPIYVINLESRKDRLDYIKDEFNKQNINNYQIFKATDGSSEDLSLIVENFNNLGISKNEIACSVSHLNAIKHWLENSDSEYAIVMEDDISFETVKYWQWDWNEFLSKITVDHDMIQLSITNRGSVNTSLHYREFLDCSTLCYLIKRSWAEKLVKRHFINNKIFFHKITPTKIVADGVLYDEAICLSFPLFTTYLKFNSSIHEDHVDKFHRKSRDEVMEFWKTKPVELKRRLNNNV